MSYQYDKPGRRIQRHLGERIQAALRSTCRCPLLGEQLQCRAHHHDCCHSDAWRQHVASGHRRSSEQQPPRSRLQLSPSLNWKIDGASSPPPSGIHQSGPLALERHRDRIAGDFGATSVCRRFAQLWQLANARDWQHLHQQLRWRSAPRSENQRCSTTPTISPPARSATAASVA